MLLHVTNDEFMADYLQFDIESRINRYSYAMFKMPVDEMFLSQQQKFGLMPSVSVLFLPELLSCLCA